MPLLSMRLVFDGTSRQKVVLAGAIPKQPLILKHASVYFAGADASINSLLVQLPFLNMYDINSNCAISDAIPIPVDPNSDVAHAYLDLEFNPARSIDESFDWKVYDQEGELYEDQNFDIVLLWTYRRPEII